MKIVIYQALILEIIVMLNEVYTEEVYMRNVSELLGTDGIDLTCSYTVDSGDLAVGVDFFAMNDTDTFVKIAEFIILSDTWRLLTYGEYLFGSVNITKINHSTSEVVLSFNDLNCKHNRNYRCSLGIYNKAPSFSTPIGIYVQVTPIKPDGLVMISTPINVSMTTEIPSVNNFTFPDYTTDNSSIITTNSYNSSIENNTTNSSNESANIMEGDTITFQCYGNVGKPAGIFIFKKFRKDNTQSTYNATTTEIVEIPGKCSYYRTSYLTFQVTAEDNQAVIRCAVISLLENDDMYVDSEQLEVESDKTTPSTSGSGLNKAKDNGTVIVVVVVVLIVIGVVVVLQHRRIRTNEEYKPVDKMESNMDQIESQETTQTVPSTSSTKKTSGYEDIDLDDTDMKFKLISDEETIDKVKQNNEEYLKKQKEDEDREKDNPTTPPQAAVYACVNKPKNTTTTENKPPADQQEEDVYEESKEGLYDTSGERRHKENITAEHFDSIENLKSADHDHIDLFSEQKSQNGAYINKAFENDCEIKEEKRQVATVSPTVRSSFEYKGDGQDNKSNQKQSTKSNQHVKT